LELLLVLLLARLLVLLCVAAEALEVLSSGARMNEEGAS
jgi:hypothetical protein